MNIILLGAPGAGKGTQAAFISQKFQIPTISTGNLLREQVDLGTELGLAAKVIMDKGGLVSDEIILGMLKDRTSQSDCEKGFILDGVPRTIPQAEGIDKLGIKVDAVLDIEISEAEVLNRLGGRRYCPDCKSTFHVKFNPPKVEGVCDKCGANLIVRDDDKADVIKQRLSVYHDQTAPLTEYYKKQDKLYVIEGDKSVDEVKEQIKSTLEAFL